MHRQIMEFGDCYHIVRKRPQASIDDALRTVIAATQAKYGFAYLTVYEHAWRDYEDKIKLRAKLFKQYKKLKLSLKLLFDEGTIKSYTCLATGRLFINWFSGHVKMDLVVLDETFIKKLQIFYDCTNLKHYKLTSWWEYLNVPDYFDMQYIGSVGRYIYKHRDEIVTTEMRVHQRQLERQSKLWADDHEEWKADYRKHRSHNKVTAMRTTLKDVF